MATGCRSADPFHPYRRSTPMDSVVLRVLAVIAIVLLIIWLAAQVL